jgi:hypothetical protein
LALLFILSILRMSGVSLHALHMTTREGCALDARESREHCDLGSRESSERREPGGLRFSDGLAPDAGMSGWAAL